MMGYWGWGFPDKPIRKNGKMSYDKEISDGVGLVSIPHPEGVAELAAEIICIRAENERLRKALKAILDDATDRNPVRMTFEVSDKVLVEAEAALHDKNV